MHTHIAEFSPPNPLHTNFCNVYLVKECRWVYGCLKCGEDVEEIDGHVCNAAAVRRLRRVVSG